MLTGLYVFMVVFTGLWTVIGGLSSYAHITTSIKSPAEVSPKALLGSLSIFTASLSLFIAFILGRLL